MVRAHTIATIGDWLTERPRQIVDAAGPDRATCVSRRRRAGQIWNHRARDAGLTERLAIAAHAGVILTCGVFGNIIWLLPPLTIGDELLSEGAGHRVR